MAAARVRDEVVTTAFDAPPINLHTPDLECLLDYVPNLARRMPVRVAATDAFGFGGQNCVTVFSEPQSNDRKEAS